MTPSATKPERNSQNHKTDHDVGNNMVRTPHNSFGMMKSKHSNLIIYEADKTK